jgi:hypothetical protein
MGGKHRPRIEAADMTLRRHLKCRHTMNKKYTQGRFHSLKTNTRRKKSAKAATIPESPKSNILTRKSCSLPNNHESDHQQQQQYDSMAASVWSFSFDSLFFHRHDFFASRLCCSRCVNVNACALLKKCCNAALRRSIAAGNLVWGVSLLFFCAPQLKMQ